MAEKNEFEWEHTPIFLDYLTRLAQEKPDTLCDLFQQKCFATEKLDGTNVSKDDKGVIYSKRTVIGKELTFYSKRNSGCESMRVRFCLSVCLSSKSL